MNRIRHGGVETARQIKDVVIRSKLANFIYYRGLAFIRSTFIYDLTVTEGHIVLRGVSEFLLLLPYHIVRGTWYFCMRVSDVVGQIYMTFYVIWVDSTYPAIRRYTQRAFFSLIRFLNLEHDLRIFYLGFLYFINSEPLSSIRVFFTNTGKVSGYIAAAYARLGRSLRIHTYRIETCLVSSIGLHSAGDWILFLVVVPLVATVFALGLLPFWFFYKASVLVRSILRLVIARPVRFIFCCCRSLVRSIWSFIRRFRHSETLKIAVRNCRLLVERVCRVSRLADFAVLCVTRFRR